MPKLTNYLSYSLSHHLTVLFLVGSIAGLGSALAQGQDGDKKTPDNPETKKPKSTITLSTLKLVDAKKPADPAAPAREIKVLQISGSISRALLANIKQQPMSNELDPIPAGMIVMLDSKGGDGIAGMEIGRILRAAKAHVFVTGECSSACIFVLSGGVVRGAPTFSVGIHQARITLSNSSGAIAKEVDSSSNPTAKALLEQYESMAPRYFADMGIPADLFIAMQSFPAKRLHRLSSQEITLYGLNGIEDEYLMQRTQLYEEQPGRWPKDKDEFLRRTMKVSTECMPFDKNPVDFVKCYRRTLQDIY
jgi:ATP-dependent protease ClpP protease subunit